MSIIDTRHLCYTRVFTSVMGTSAIKRGVTDCLLNENFALYRGKSVRSYVPTQAGGSTWGWRKHFDSTNYQQKLKLGYGGKVYLLTLSLAKRRRIIHRVNTANYFSKPYQAASFLNMVHVHVHYITFFKLLYLDVFVLIESLKRANLSTYHI